MPQTSSLEILATISLSLSITLLLVGPASAAPGEELLVGVLSEQHSQRCLPGRQEWVDAHEEVGFVRLAAPARAARAWTALRGKIVVARGRPLPSFRPPRIEHTGECPQAQMRSDMVWAREGFRLRRSGTASEKLRAFAATRVEACPALTLRRTRETIGVSFKNTLGRALEQVVLTMHYEGCYGKPGSMQREHRVAKLAPGESTTASFPPLDSRAERRDRMRLHHAYSVQVSAAGTGVHFDLDRRLADEGISIPCPKRTR